MEEHEEEEWSEASPSPDEETNEDDGGSNDEASDGSESEIESDPSSSDDDATGKPKKPTKHDLPDYSGHCIRVVGRMSKQYTDGALYPLITGRGIILDISAVSGSMDFSPWSNNGASSRAITAIRFGSSLKHVASIPEMFLSIATLELFQIDADGLPHARRIHHNFLTECLALREVDLGPFHNVTSIGGGFLSDSGIRSIDLYPLRNVQSIRDSFLERCSHLQLIDLSPLSRVSTISTCFLSFCSGLTAIDFTPLRSLQKMNPNGWLWGCRSLSGSIDLRPLGDVEIVRSHCLKDRRYDSDLETPDSDHEDDYNLLWIHDPLLISSSRRRREHDRIVNGNPPVRVLVPSRNKKLI